MQAPFKSFNYKVEVITPIHIGAAKENDYALGQDYFYDNGWYCFVHKRKLFKTLTNQQITSYASALAQNNVSSAEAILKKAAEINPDLIYHESPCPFTKQPSLKKHIADGMGNLIIPGSSLKGALSGIIGKYLMQKNSQTEFKSREIFGDINNNLMRYLQVGDITFAEKGEITPFKIFSGDIRGKFTKDFEGIGQWKHERNGGHTEDFEKDGFVTHVETLIEGYESNLRLNWAAQLFDFIQVQDKHPNPNARFFKSYSGNNWMAIAKAHTKQYLEQEVQFFEKFGNERLDAIGLITALLDENEEQDSVIIRLGMGSGFHAITGNWRYKDHVKSMPQAEDRGRNLMNAIKYKTRKVAFYDVDNETCLQFPGYLKLSMISG